MVISGPIEIIALVVAVITLVKLLFILFSAKSWQAVVRFVYRVPALTMIVFLILAGAIYYYLDAVGITIVQIFAVMGFVACLMIIGVAAYSKEMIAFGSKMLKDKKIVKKAWLSILLWAILAVYVLYKILM